jgi:hypothetical protein
MEMQPHQQRVVDELNELSERAGKLLAFLQSPTFQTLSKAEKNRLRHQSNYMSGYAMVLRERIEAFNTEE